MSERDLETVAAIMRAAPVVLTPRAGRDSRNAARAVLDSEWFTSRLAEVWDEGYRKGVDDALISDDTRAEFNRKPHVNPYRNA